MFAQKESRTDVELVDKARKRSFCPGTRPATRREARRRTPRRPGDSNRSHPVHRRRPELTRARLPFPSQKHARWRPSSTRPSPTWARRLSASTTTPEAPARRCPSRARAASATAPG
ncbi:hypothetical protein M885DRAFT_583263, partial [Pelagophyceae sp. CCMP2097]